MFLQILSNSAIILGISTHTNLTKKKKTKIFHQLANSHKCSNFIGEMEVNSELLMEDNEVKDVITIMRNFMRNPLIGV